MSILWDDVNERTQARARAARLRMGAFALALISCAGLSYLAVTQRFGVISDWIPDPPPIHSILEPEPEIITPPPPPVVRDETPPPTQYAALDPSAPATPTYDIIDLNPTPPAPPTRFLTNPAFIDRPSGRDFERYFPQRALERGQSGAVVLDCAVGADGRIGCVVESESPSGWGFGEASLRAARHFRVAPATADGAPTSGGRLRVPMTWRAQ